MLKTLSVAYIVSLFVHTRPKDAMFGAIAGYGLGGSTIALFGRVGGGICTEAAGVGADLSGKNEYGLEEDDKRSPACIANNVGDNIGDNIGDIAGLGADLFGSFAEVTCAAVVLVASSDALQNSWKALMYPVLISSLGIAVGISTLVLRTLVYRVHDEYGALEKALKGILTISIVLMSPVLVVLSWMCLPDQFDMSARITGVRWWYCVLAISLGLWSGLLIGFAGNRRISKAVLGHWCHLRPCFGLRVNRHSSGDSWHHDPCCPFIVRRRGTGSLGRPWRTDNGILPSMRSSLSRTTRAASMRCRNSMSGSENAPTYLAQQGIPLRQFGNVLRSGPRLL